MRWSNGSFPTLAKLQEPTHLAIPNQASTMYCCDSINVNERVWILKLQQVDTERVLRRPVETNRLLEM